MNRGLMMRWIENCFKSRGNYFSRTKSVLFMDSYGSHKDEGIVKALKTSCNTDVVLIPPKTTSLLQPLDVSLNAPFKTALHASWNDWFTNGPQEFTEKGYRRKPTYQYIVDFVNEAASNLRPEIVKTAFECCGIAEKGANVAKGKLNGRLVNLLNAGEADAAARDRPYRVVFAGLEEERDEEGSEAEELEEQSEITDEIESDEAESGSESSSSEDNVEVDVG